MKVIIISLIFIIPLNTFAQIPYTDFIQTDTAIQWAAEYNQILNITPKVSRFGIRNILLTKLMRGECIDNYTTNADGAFKSSFCLKDTGLNHLAYTSINPFRDKYNKTVNYNELFPKSSEIKNSYQDYVMNAKFHCYKIKQILVYKQGNLFVNNVLLTPLYFKDKIDSLENEFSWYDNYSTCFNEKFKPLTSSEKTKCIDLGDAAENYDLNYILNTSKNEMKIFTTLNPIFSRHVFEDIFANKITAVDEKGNIITPKKIFDVNNPPISFNVFDNDGNLVGKRYARNEVNIDSLYNFWISEHFYFDTVKNVLNSEINYIEVRRRCFTNAAIYLGLSFHFRIYFIKPSQYKKRPQKKFLN
jgi:hypothetical protein